MKKIIALTLVLSMALLLFSCSSQDDVMTATVLKVGKADASIIRQGDVTVVIDCGEKDDGDDVAEYAGEKIDLLILTHFDKDHIGGAAEVISSCQIDKIIMPDYTPDNPDSDEYTALETALENTSSEVETCDKDEEFTLGTMQFHLFSADDGYEKNVDNNNSLMVGIEHDGTSLLFAGDVQKQRIKDILKDGIGEYDFLKVPHHGVLENNSEEFLTAVNPTYAVITCSDKNPADEEILDILQNLGTKTFLTSAGNVTVTSAGGSLLVTQ